MATQYDPNKPASSDPTRNNDRMADRSSNMSTYGIAAAVAVAAAVGLLFWNMSDNNNTADMNKAPGVTTGSSSTTTAPSSTTTAPTTAPMTRPAPSTPDANKINTK